MRYFLISIFFIGLGFTSQAQPVYRTPFENAQRNMYQLKMDAVRENIQQMREKNEENWRIAYIQNSVSFLEQFVNEDEERFDEERANFEKRIELVEEDGVVGPEYYLYLGEMNLHIAALEAKYGHFWSASGYAFSGLDKLKEGQRLYPNYEPMFAGMGMLNVAIGSVPDNYKWITSTLGFTGDIEAGFRYLTAAVEASDSREWAYLKHKHVFLYGYVTQQLFPEELTTIKELGVDPATNPLLAFLESKILINQGRIDELIELFDAVFQLEDRCDFPYLTYQYGRSKLARRDADAERYLLQFLEQNRGVNYVKSTLRYLHWSARLKGDSERSARYRSRALEEGATDVGADIQAQRELEEVLVPLELLEARLLFDSGQLQRALDKLTTIDPSNYASNYKAEYYYRKGKVYQSLDRNSEAIAAYRMAASINFDPPTHELVNAHLQLAILLEDSNPLMARGFYREVLAFDDYPWYEGTQQKAKVGLSRLDE